MYTPTAPNHFKHFNAQTKPFSPMTAPSENYSPTFKKASRIKDIRADLNSILHDCVAKKEQNESALKEVWRTNEYVIEQFSPQSDFLPEN